MLKYLLFALLSFNLFALEVSLTGAKENFSKYSTLHIKDIDKFLCQETKDDFEVTTEIVCAFRTGPTTKFKKLQNDFFTITSVNKKKTFFLIIKPTKKIKLYPMIFNLSKESTIFNTNVKLAKHWMIIGYDKELPYIKNDKKLDTAINFPFLLAKDSLPFVGGLDIKGNPVHIKKVQDVTDYLKLKKLYDQDKYEQSLELIDDITQNYPDSLFNAEFLFYKIRVFNKIEDFDNVVASSKIYLREYSSDENVPEVLALTAKAYSQIGLSTDADYFFDRIFSEHLESPYTKWAYIYKGEMLEASGSSKKALSFYEKALNETENIEIAATAAYKLAEYKVSFSRPKEGSKYAMKIINAMPSFFMNDLEKSLKMMGTFVEESEFETAAAIAKAITDETDKNHDEYERLLKDIGLWLAKTPKKQEALIALNNYIEKYKYGMFIDEVQFAKDALFFDTTDANVTAKLTQYNELISTYMDDSIGNRATYEKAKLLLDNEMYSDILGIKESILELDDEKYSDTEDMIKNAAIGVMKSSLKAKECHEVITISSEYNITLSNKWDDGIYECSMMGGDYALSKKIATRNLKSEDLELRKKWLFRYIKVDFETGNYSDVIEASKELIELMKEDKQSKYQEVYRFLFDTYQRLEDSDKLIDAIINIEKVYGFTYKDIDRYVSMISVANRTKDNSMLIKYASEVIKIQKKSSSYAQSPYVEFTLYQAYINKDFNTQALETIKSLDDITLKPKQRARQKYLLGSIYDKLWREENADKAYQEAIDADPTSSWAELAKAAKGI